MSIHDSIKEKLKAFCIHHEIDSSHGYEHACEVMQNACMVIETWDEPLVINGDVAMMITVAALLHDADDAKYFPDSNDYEHARELLRGDIFSSSEIETIIQMIDLVSTSKNKDTVPEGLPLWMLIPRYSDRLEAIGVIGLERAYEYTKKKIQPMYLESTVRPQSLLEIEATATKERYEKYTNASVSLVDHIYDKLLHLNKFPIRNEYLDNECEKRMQPLYDFLLEFGRKGEMSSEEIYDFIKK